MKTCCTHSIVLVYLVLGAIFIPELLANSTTRHLTERSDHIVHKYYIVLSSFSIAADADAVFK